MARILIYTSPARGHLFAVIGVRGPPFGPGLRRSTSGPGRVRDVLLRRLIFSKMNRVAMPAVDEMRARVEHAAAGVRLLPSRLNAESLAAAVTKAVSMSHGAKRIADAFAAADADRAVADGLEELLKSQRVSVA